MITRFKDEGSIAQIAEKETNARLRLLHRHPFCRDLMKRFGYDIFHRTSLTHSGFVEFFEKFKQPRWEKMTLVEIGTWNGLTSLFLKQYFNRVITCDIEDNPNKYDVWGNTGGIEFILLKPDKEGSFEADKEKIFMNDKMKFDFAYLDGNHRKPDVDWKILNKCKTGLVHEAWDVAPENAIRVSSHPNHRIFGFNFAYIGPEIREVDN